MKSHKLLLLITLLAALPWQAARAQTTQTTLVAQAAPPAMPMPTADEKTAPANAIGEPVPGALTGDGKKMPATGNTQSPQAGSSPRQQDPGADTQQPPAPQQSGDKRPSPQGGQVPIPGRQTGESDNAGMPGAGASPGSSAGAQPR